MRLRTCVVFLALWLVPVVCLCASRERAASDVTVIEGVLLIDGTGALPRENAAIILKGGRIHAIVKASPERYPKSAQILSFRGKTVIPGLINAHGHLGMVRGTSVSANNYTRENIQRQLDQYERYGVTTIVSLGLNRDLVYSLREEQRRGSLSGASVFTADRGIGVEGGAPPAAVPPDQVYRPTTPDAARAAVDEMAARHADLVKIWVDDFYGALPRMKPEIYRAVIDEAHRHALKVASHVFYLADAKSLVQAGVDILAHSIRDRSVDRELIEAMKRRNVAYIPTLALDESFFEYADHPAWMEGRFFRQALGPGMPEMLLSSDYLEKVRKDPKTPEHRANLATAEKNLKSLFEAGVTIGFGTDSGANPFRVQGFAEHRELQLMVAAGLTPLQSLMCATRSNARLLGASTEVGTLELGKSADFVILDGSPLEDISNTTKIVAVWHNGRQVHSLTGTAD